MLEVHRVEYADSPEGRIETHVTETTEIITTKEPIGDAPPFPRPPCSPGQDSPTRKDSPMDSPPKSHSPSPPRSTLRSGSLSPPSPKSSSPKVSPKETSAKDFPHETGPLKTQPDRLSPTRADIGITPPTSPEMTTQRTEEKILPKNTDHLQTQAQSEDAFVFSPPTVIRETQERFSTPVAVQTTPSLEYLFSPPLTRSKARRHSLDVTKSGHVIRYLLTFFYKLI